MVHNDIKLNNLMIEPHSGRVVLIDFGAALRVGPTMRDLDNELSLHVRAGGVAVEGNLPHKAPEVLRALDRHRNLLRGSTEVVRVPLGAQGAFETGLVLWKLAMGGAHPWGRDYVLLPTHSSNYGVEGGFSGSNDSGSGVGISSNNSRNRGDHLHANQDHGDFVSAGADAVHAAHAAHAELQLDTGQVARLRSVAGDEYAAVTIELLASSPKRRLDLAAAVARLRALVARQGATVEQQLRAQVADLQQQLLRLQQQQPQLLHQQRQQDQQQQPPQQQLLQHVEGGGGGSGGGGGGGNNQERQLTKQLRVAEEDNQRLAAANSALQTKLEAAEAKLLRVEAQLENLRACPPHHQYHESEEYDEWEGRESGMEEGETTEHQQFEVKQEQTQQEEEDYEADQDQDQQQQQQQHLAQQQQQQQQHLAQQQERVKSYYSWMAAVNAPAAHQTTTSTTTTLQDSQVVVQVVSRAASGPHTLLPSVRRTLSVAVAAWLRNCVLCMYVRSTPAADPLLKRRKPHDSIRLVTSAPLPQ